MVTCVNGMVVCRICWLAGLAKKSVIWVSMARISFGPALLKLLKRSPPPPVVVVNATVGAAGPVLVPNGDGMVIKRVAEARLVPLTWMPEPIVAVTENVIGLGRNVGVGMLTLLGIRSARSSWVSESWSWGAKWIAPEKFNPLNETVALSRLRLTVTVPGGKLTLKSALTSRPVAR